MHRQAMLVSLSLSPASTAAKNDKHWAFLEEIDAPQWADLKAEEVLAKAGTIGDDPWFYRSHSHHEVPLTEITGAHAAAIQDSNISGNVITPNLERKKNRGTSKAKLAFDGPPAAKPKDAAREDRFDESPSRDISNGCHEIMFGDSPRNRIASPVHCKSPEQFLPTRRFISSVAASDDRVAGSGGTGLLGISRLRVNMFESQYVHEKVQSTGSDEPIPSTSSTEQSAAAREVEEGPAEPCLSWQHTFLSKLNDASRLRKSLGSALRVKVEDPSDNPATKQTGVTLPKSRLINHSMQLESAALPAAGGCERDTTSLKEDTASLRTATDGGNGSCQSEAVRPEDSNSGEGLANKLGINSSVQAFDDIRKMRKSWGSALRVPKVSDEPVVEDQGSKPQASEVSPVSDATGSVKSPNERVVDLPSLLKAIRTGAEEKKQPGANLPSIVRAKERRTHNRSESVDVGKLDMDVSSPKVPAAAVAAKKVFRRSVSFDHTPGRGTEPVRSSSSSRSNLAQQRPGSRASPSSRLNTPAEKLDKGSRLAKGGKENTTLHTSTKTTKPNPEPSVQSPRLGRQAVTRTSMPSLTFAAHARAALHGGGGTILKPSGLNTVVETNRSDSSKAAVPATSASRKSSVGLDNGTRKKTAACPTSATYPAKMVTRQSILRSSMPVFTASGAKHSSKPVTETVTALKSGHKSSGKVANGDPDLAAMLAEHNRKFRQKPKYEPRIHSVKDIREWEARTGQKFYSLLPAEREKANQDISAAKQTRQK